MRSGSKTFNIAGLKNAYVFTQNKEFLNRIDRQFNINEINDLSPFGITATVAAYNECDDWIAELNDYIQDNYKLLVKFFKENYPEVHVANLESTYLAWVDCSCFNMSGTEIKNTLLNKGKLYVNDGEMYMSPYPSFLRINLGCPRAYLEEALKRFKKALGQRFQLRKASQTDFLNQTVAEILLCNLLLLISSRISNPSPVSWIFSQVKASPFI